MADTLAAALAELQTQLPPIKKDETANAGTYSYSYADLAQITERIMPLLGKVGLSFIAKPTLVDGKFVLAYSLLHESGDREDGQYPLGTGTHQQLGSAITYARRYCLCAVTGVAPSDDDDDARAAAHRQPQQEAPPSPRAVAWHEWKTAGLTPDAAVMKDAFAAWSQGEDITSAADDTLTRFTMAIKAGAFTEYREGA